MTRLEMAPGNDGCGCPRALDVISAAMTRYSVHDSQPMMRRRGLSLFLLLRIGKMSAVTLVMAAAILSSVGHVTAQNQYGGMVEQKFAMEPQDQTAIVGSRVTLPCRVVGKLGVLQWTKDDFGLGAHRNLSGYERYSMIGSDEEGDYSLDIFPVQLDDDAKYQCQVSPGPLGQPAIRSRFASVSVLVPPEAPKILQGSLLQATEDQPIELECVSAAGKPAAEITWIDGEGTVLSARARNSVLPTADGRKFTARSVLRLVPKRAQHGGTLACQAQNTADRQFRAAVIKLEVKYAPVVSVKILSGAASNGRIPEGAEVRLGCKAEANPNDLNYRWYLNDDLVVGDYTTEMVIYNVSRKLHDSIVKCEVHNSVGKSEESETLDVTYGPRFRSPPTDVAADLGGSVTLSCDLDGNPHPAITWLHEDQDRWSVVGSTPNLTLTVDSSTAGRYNCKASVHGFPEIEADAVVYLKGPPKIVSPRSQIGMEGDNARIECRVISVPRPVHLMWSHAGREINTHNDQDFSILEDPLADGVKSILVIRDSQYKHFGTYNCSVTNEYGSDVVEIQLVPQTSFPLLLILSALIGGGIVLIALIIVLVLCARRKGHHGAPQGKGEGVGGKPDVMVDAEHKDRTSYISDLKLDLKLEDGCNPEYAGEEFRTGLPLAGPVPLPADRAALLMQYSRYSNDYSDHAFPPNIDFKDGHNNNAYSGYIDYSREYNPPPPLPLHVKSPSINGMDAHSASRLHLGSNYRPPSSGGDSLHRRGVGDIELPHASGSLQRRAKADANSIGIPSVTYDTVGLLQHPNGGLKQNGSGMLTPNGVDIRYAATYGNPYLRAAGGLSTVNTANPAATPAPPPYNSIRNSTINMMPSGSNPHISGSPAQPQAAPQSPASKYILPSVSQNPTQMVQLTKKGAGTQQSLATHV